MIPKSRAPKLLPRARIKHQSTSTLERTRNPRLNGADIYVARFGGFGKSARSKRPPPAPLKPEPDVPLSRCSSSEGSLHAELLNPFPKPDSRMARAETSPLDLVDVHASRPCYRCVSYMHSVGIRRVFWTTDDGEWEGAKVRDLVDALDGGGEGGGCGMFVTKHEVLMMRRLMGGST